MRFVVFGAGAIGGVVGARLFQGGHEVVLIARGAHRQAIAERGLLLESPEETVRLSVPVVGGPAELEWRPDDVVLLCVKSQDTDAALRSLAAVAPPTTAVVCVQNGVENERRALRVFPDMCVMCPATYLEPGKVQAHWAGVTALLDLGRYPSGTDDTARDIAAALSTSRIDSHAVGDIMRWKYCKLLMNLGNALEALCGPTARQGEMAAAIRGEGETALEAAGIAYASLAEDAECRRTVTGIQATASGEHRGGSSWQSLARGTGTIETDYLSGEIVLLGRLHGVPTPVNSLVQRLANELSVRGGPPGTMTEAELWAMLDS
jgi:2-dehydropantoate 2-reductase